jgi:hypothetical protein
VQAPLHKMGHILKSNVTQIPKLDVPINPIEYTNGAIQQRIQTSIIFVIYKNMTDAEPVLQIPILYISTLYQEIIYTCYIARTYIHNSYVDDKVFTCILQYKKLN